MNNPQQNRRDLDGWHLDKKVPLSLIFAMLVQAAMVIWAVADIKKDVELLKADNIVLHEKSGDVNRGLKDAFNHIRGQYDKLNDKLDRLMERGQLR